MSASRPPGYGPFDVGPQPEQPEFEGDPGSFSLSGCVLGCIVPALASLGLAFTLIFFGSPSRVDQAAVSPANPLDDIYNAGGQLIPISGVWNISNQTGAVTCAGDISLEAQIQRSVVEVGPGGETITVTNVTAGARDEPIVMTRESGDEYHAVYYADLSERTGVDDFEMWVEFTSSSTVGGRLEGCPDRGAEGWLVEANP